MKQTNQTKIKQNILISACLLGRKVRYNGTDLLIEHLLIKKWQKEARLIEVCPEVAGGMSTPRAPAEIVDGNGEQVIIGEAQVIDCHKQDVTQYFISGAKKALKIAKDNNCIAAILTDRSPSCGSNQIYDGSFSGTRMEGMGVTSALLVQNNIRVFNQNQLEQLAKYLEKY